jgi:hypothetical protein
VYCSDGVCFLVVIFVCVLACIRRLNMEEEEDV